MANDKVGSQAAQSIDANITLRSKVAHSKVRVAEDHQYNIISDALQ